jgi:hypothetical protein
MHVISISYSTSNLYCVCLMLTLFLPAPCILSACYLHFVFCLLPALRVCLISGRLLYVCLPCMLFPLRTYSRCLRFCARCLNYVSLVFVLWPTAVSAYYVSLVLALWPPAVSAYYVSLVLAFWTPAVSALRKPGACIMDACCLCIM